MLLVKRTVREIFPVVTDVVSTEAQDTASASSHARFQTENSRGQNRVLTIGFDTDDAVCIGCVPEKRHITPGAGHSNSEQTSPCRFEGPRLPTSQAPGGKVHELSRGVSPERPECATSLKNTIALCRDSKTIPKSTGLPRGSIGVSDERLIS
jgi:hypothetical protein